MEVKWLALVVVLAFAVGLAISLELFSSHSGGQGGTTSQSASNIQSTFITSSKASSSTPVTTSSTTTETNGNFSIYYIYAPDTMPEVHYDNYTLSMNYTMSIYQDGMPELSNSTSGALYFSAANVPGSQSLGTFRLPPGNITLDISFRPLEIYTVGYPHQVTPETTSYAIDVQNLQAEAYSRNYSVILTLNYTSARNLTYRFNGSQGVTICLRPNVTSISDSYFVVLPEFSLYRLDNSSTCK